MGYLNYKHQYTNLPEGSGRSGLANSLLTIGGGTSLIGSGYLGNKFYNQERKLTDAAIRKASELADAQIGHWLPALATSTSNGKQSFIDTVGKVTGALKEDYGILGEMAGFKNEANAAQAARNFFQDTTPLKDGDTVRIKVKPSSAAELSASLDAPIEKNMKLIWSKGRIIPRAGKFGLIGGLLGLGGLSLYKGIGGNVQNDKAKEAYMNFRNEAIKARNRV